MLDMKYEKENDKTARLLLSGELTVMNTIPLHKKILEIFEDVDSLSISLEKISKIDMTFAQLLCASHKAYSHADKIFSIEGDCAALYSRTDDLGYTRHKGCGNDKNDDCVLVRKEVH
ncbi:lipid asymmetry maintenance protein MlaB [Deferribacteres bacterium DY0037]